MRLMIRNMLLFLMIYILLISAINAQENKGQNVPPHQTEGPSVTSPSTNEPKRPQNEVSPSSSSGRVAFYVSLANLFDSNIHQDEEGRNSYGVVPGLGIYYRNHPDKPSLEMNYEVAFHSYTNTDRWDRVSHNFRTSYEHRLTRRWRSETTGQISIKGSSEERELTNQYILEQELEYRFTPNNRFGAFGAYRLKRYSDDPGRNSINPYIGGRFQQRLSGNRSWEVLYRYDHNRSQSPRSRYIRWTYGAEFSTPVFSRNNLLTIEARYRPQLYARQIRVNRERVPRRDQRWILDVSWQRPAWRDVQMALNYRFEKRNSNDPDRRFNEHIMGVTFTYRWWWK